MANKKILKSLFLFFKSFWLNAFFVGIMIGIASQHIPELRAYTEKMAVRLNKLVEQVLSFDNLQDIVLRKRWKR